MTAPAVSREVDKLRRNLLTPEGVPIGIRLADAGERAAAFGIDMIIITVVIVLLVTLAAFATGREIEGTWAGAFVMVVAFFLRNFYFIAFELRWQGSTPGKRMVHLRVIDRHGGPLRADSVIARNLLRDVEFFLPAQLMLAPEAMWPNAPGWALIGAGVWAFALALLPVFNRDRLRAGDLVGGTMVARAPRTELLQDLGRSKESAALTFTREQLAIYGVYELQVLEGLLRSEMTVHDNVMAADAVADRIKQKIGWDMRQRVPTEQFLREFYTALRERLERDMLLGKRQEDKYSRKN